MKLFRQWSLLLLVLMNGFLPIVDATSADDFGNRLAYLDGPVDPYYVHHAFARLTTPQWTGDASAEAVVVLAIDDMRDPDRYEAYLRPILDRLKQVQGRTGMSIMTNEVDPRHEQLGRWLDEGVSMEVHTIDHPCPLLFDSDFAKARSTFERCVDLMGTIPGNEPVAFRMPCCDSMNSPSPRFYESIFGGVTAQGRYLTIDSSVFTVTNDRDGSLPPELLTDSTGLPRFQKYLPFPSFVNVIQNYPFPYVIGGICWEFPCMVPSDWEGQNLHQPNNPQTVDDLKAALDVVVRKQGVLNLVFHPHGWMRNDQVVELIDHAEQQHPGKVLFLSFWQVQELLNRELLAGHPLRRADGSSNNVSLADLDHDGLMDVLRFEPGRQISTRIWDAAQQRWHAWTIPVTAERLHAGVLDESGRATLVGVEGNGLTVYRLTTDEAGAWSWQANALRLGPESGVTTTWQSRLTQPLTLDGIRLRDLDADGRCELIVSEGDEALILRRTDTGWTVAMFGLPKGVVLATASGKDAGVRLVDLDGDGRHELLFSDSQRYCVARFVSWDVGWEVIVQSERSAADQPLPQLAPFVRPDGTNNGVWAHSNHLWWQNEDTARLPDKVHRLAFVDLLAGKSTEQPALEGRPSDQVDREQAAGEQVAAELSGADFPGPVEPEQAVDTFRSSESLRIELVAAEPLVTDPVAFDWGPDGRLWVAEMRDYPVADGADHARRGRVRVLLDDDQDGRYDRAEPFLEGLFYPTGVMAWRNGVLISGAPHLIYAEDTDGDFRADVQRVVVQGFGEGNQQHRVNGLRWGVDGWVYLANGDSGGSISLPGGDQTWNLGGRDVRIQPDAGKLELLSGQTQFIRCRDDLGNWFGGNNSDPLWHYLLEDRYLARNPAYAAPSVRRQVPERPGPAPVFPASKTLPRFNDFDRADRFTSACGPLVVYHYQGTAVSSIDFGPAGSMDSYVCEPVHNLVHRERMEVEGLSFRSRRLPQDEAAEFLASTDSWFRPVMIRSGPDGALWVADMYRLVIEHPEWIPQHWQQQLDLNAGHDRGRIYRITPRASEPLTALPRLNDLSDQELVERLASPIRWQRDMAHQMIVWRNARQVVPALREMAEQAQWPVSRIQALYAIAALDGIEAPWLAQLIQSAPPEVACHAVALSEPHLSQPGPLLESVLTRGAASDDLPLRRQIACSLGFATDPRAAKCLAELALGSPIEPIVQAAVFSSLTEQNVREVMMHARNLEVAVAADKRAFMRQLLTQAVVLGDRATQELVLASLLEPADADATTWRIETLADVLMRYERKHGGTQSLPDTIQQGIQQMMQSAQSVSVDRTAASTLRLAAVELLGRAEASAEVLRTLGELLDPRQPPELQTEAARTLLQVSEQEAMPLILAQWPGYSPRMRNRILDQVMGRAELTQAMLHEASQRQLDLQLDARRRQQLLAARDPKIAEAAKTLLQSGTAEDRSALIARYLPAHELSGDVTRGRQVFQRACSTCHQLDGLGHAVGPDLAALSNKSVEFLVASILDPNQAVESSYLDYLVETVDGRQLTGLLQAETGSGVTLLAADGKEQRVPREEIEMMQTTGKSLMPEGLEKDMSPADMHDLLIYLRSHQPQRKLFAGNQPQDAPRRDDGSIRLLAMHAEIFGPSLVFEPQYRNLGFWSSPQDYAAWTVEVPAAGIYEVVLEYACPDDAAGNRFVLSCRDQFVSGEIRGTGTWDNYAWRDVGMIELPAGRSRIVLRADGPLSSYLLDLHQIILYPQ